VISNNLIELKNHFYQDIDEAKCLLKIKATKVNTEKNWRKWDWDLLLEIFEGNLITSNLLDQLITREKFIKRLVNFYTPTKQQFVNLPWVQENLKYAQVGFFLFKRLLQEPKGRNVLSAKKKVFTLIGVAYVHNQDNIFNHKKSFM